ncbi:hypothetical protein FH603_5023 [Spirosoma sp. LMG 31447]|uniref:Ig-like domain-containing protein n=1 Tax=Spirosoma utsteinense TaxID=2585773 RepID=A0ABR6WDX5_9BACT|nr:hypothetical protein [Spirosoma utsteinense]
MTDYLYLNDPNTSVTNGGCVHKFRLNPNNTATEIKQPSGSSWVPTGAGLPKPHGLGQDLNGNLYVGQTENGPIAKIRCDGTIVNPNFINDGGFNFVSKDGHVYVNTSGANGDRINRYALCDGSFQGYITLGGGISTDPYVYDTEKMVDWGLEIDPDGTFYVSAGFNVVRTDKDTHLYRFRPQDSDFINHTNYNPNKSTGVGRTFVEGPGTSGISNRVDVWGITHDRSGNIYLVLHDVEPGVDVETWVLKFDTNFNLVGSVMEPNGSPTGGFEGARGIVYYPGWNRLLLAGGPDGDCIAMIDPTTMSYAGALQGNMPGQDPKTLRIASEACPVELNTNAETTLCGVRAGDRVFLQNIVGSCQAPICGGTWTADPGNIGIDFQECDLSFTVRNVATGCGRFTLTHMGGTGASCGPFSVIVNVDFAFVERPVITGTQSVCDSRTPTPLTISSPVTGSNTVRYQWQKSTTAGSGYTDIAGATSSSYTPAVTAQTTYYQLVASVEGGCTNLTGRCSQTSDFVTVTPEACCPAVNCFPTQVNRN